jgi:hypothetical protein
LIIIISGGFTIYSCYHFATIATKSRGKNDKSRNKTGTDKAPILLTDISEDERPKNTVKSDLTDSHGRSHWFKSSTAYQAKTKGGGFFALASRFS